MPRLSLPNVDIRDFISVTSLLISILTAYWNIVRGAKFVSPPLRWIVLGLLPDTNTLIINFPIAVTNVGSSTGVIDSVYIKLTNLSTGKTERFYAWQEGKLAGQEFQGFGMEVPTPISLKAGESTVKYYTFFPNSLGFMYICGLHKISLHAYLSGRKKAINLYEQKLEIDSTLQPTPDPRIIPLIFSYNLVPREVLKVSNYGTEPTITSPIEIFKR